MTAPSDREVASISHLGALPRRDDMDRRRLPRVDLPFPAIVRGVDWRGERFTLETLLDNLSARGLYLRLLRPVAPGAALFVVVRFAPGTHAAARAPGVAVRGVVGRAELRPGDVWGVA